MEVVNKDKVEVFPIENVEDERFQSKMKQVYSDLARLIKSDLALQQKDKTLFAQYKKEDVITWINQPSKYQKQLVNLSKYLYSVSTHYRRLIGYFADMGVDSAWGVSLYGRTYLNKTKEAIKRNYNDTLTMLEIMNIHHEYNKIKKTLWVEGIYFGYEYKGDNSYFIQKLHPNFCRINGIVDGCYVFEFDFTYYDSHKYELESAAPEFKTKYRRYQQGKKDRKSDVSSRWQEISNENSIAMKLDENLDFVLPPFAGLFLDIYDIQDYKELKKVKEELENYMLLVGKIPLYDKDKEPEQYLLDMDNAIKYGKRILDAIPEEVGFAISPFESVDAIKVSETNGREKNAVSDAEESMFNAAGVNDNIFSGKATTEGVMWYSVRADESSVFALNRQFERWVNKKIKQEEKIKENFAFYFLDITVYNQKEKIREYQEMVKVGVPVKLEYLASKGIPPSRYQQKNFLENDILDMNSDWIPPLTSNVMSGNGSQEDGRPEAESGTGGDGSE